MSQIFNYIYIAAAVVFLFGAAIFVHEFGHFWVALKRGLKVEEFAIGFGPKIVSWRRNGIDYSLRWIPAGGFVKLPQMITSNALEGDGTTEAVPVPPAPAFSKILVAIAGPAMNVVFAFALASLIYFIGLPVPINPPIIGYVDPVSPEGKLGIHEDDVIVAVDGKPVKSWDDVYHSTILALTNVFQVTIVRNGASNVYALTAEAGGAMDVKTLNLDPKEHLVIGSIMSGTPAEKAGVKANDEIVSFAGKAIGSREELTKLVQARGDKQTPLVVKRGNDQLNIDITPSKDSSNKKYLLGVVYGAGKDRFAIEHPTPLAQIQDVCEKLWGTVVALVHPRESGVSASDLSGPVGIASMLAYEVKSDYRLALSFLVMLNINLAILNMLPIPVLDGGHVVMAILERIRRRPLEVRLVEYTTSVFAGLLIIFMLYVTFFDIRRIPLIHSLFKRETQIEQPANSTGSTPAAQPAP